MRTIAFLNQKGGTAKSVSCATFARCLAGEHNKRVLCIDADFQGSLSQYFDVKADGNSTWELLTVGAGYWPDFVFSTLEEIDLIPADMTLARADMPKAPVKVGNMADFVSVLQEDDAYDFCLIDCHPYLGVITQAVLMAADEVIIPIRLDLFSTDGMGELLRQVKDMRSINPKLRVSGILCTQYLNTKDERELHRELKEKLGLPVFDQMIRMSPPVIRSVNQHKSIFEVSPRSGAALDYRCAVLEYLEEVY